MLIASTTGTISKQLPLPPKTDPGSEDLHARTVFPDIIVHTRNTGNNLLVVEVKKSTNPEGDDWDKTKLWQFKSELRYQHALFIQFITGPAQDYTPTLEWS